MLMHHHLLFGRGPRLLGGPVFLLLAGLLLVGAVVLASVLLSQRHRLSAPVARVGRHVGPQSDALRILDERFARGGIDDEEYQRRRHVLASGVSWSS
jgi:putative membrane protein